MNTKITPNRKTRPPGLNPTSKSAFYARNSFMCFKDFQSKQRLFDINAINLSGFVMEIVSMKSRTEFLKKIVSTNVGISISKRFSLYDLVNRFKYLQIQEYDCSVNMPYKQSYSPKHCRLEMHVMENRYIMLGHLFICLKFFEGFLCPFGQNQR